MLSKTKSAPGINVLRGRPFAFSNLGPRYARILETVALQNEQRVRALPVSPGWERVAEQNPTTARYRSYCGFLLNRATLELYFAIRESYLALLGHLGMSRAPRFIQCWYNVHRAGEKLARHTHPYPFIGTFSAHSEGSHTRYGESPEASSEDVVLDHTNGQLLLTTGPGHFHETSLWSDPDRARVTFAFDIAELHQWNESQIFLPFDSGTDGTVS